MAFIAHQDPDKGLVPEQLLPSLETSMHNELPKDKRVSSKQGNVNEVMFAVYPLAFLLLL